MGVHLCGRCLQPRQNAESGLYASSFSISLGRSVSKRQKTGVWIPEFLQKRSDLKPNGPAQAVGKGTSSRQPSFFRILLGGRTGVPEIGSTRSALVQVRKMAWLMDSSIPISGGYRIGVDGLIDLVPGIGDVAG